MNIIRLCFLIIPFLIYSGCDTSKKQNAKKKFISIPLSYQWKKNIDKVNFTEPSGIIFHYQRETLFVVGDEGDIAEILTNGVLIKKMKIRNSDFEGITFDPSSGLLYIAIEGEEKIIEIDPENFNVLREFSIERTLMGKMLLDSDGNGIEAITFVSDPNHPEGGTFFVANQSFDLDNTKDLSAIFEIEAPIKNKSEKTANAKIIRYFSLGIIDLSGLHFDRVNDRLYVISDSHDFFCEITKTGEVIKIYDFPGDNQEGITIDNQSFLYIAQDSGGIIKIKWEK